jgi:hypothetical protein
MKLPLYPLSAQAECRSTMDREQLEAHGYPGFCGSCAREAQKNLPNTIFALKWLDRRFAFDDHRIFETFNI